MYAKYKSGILFNVLNKNAIYKINFIQKSNPIMVQQIPEWCIFIRFIP